MALSYIFVINFFYQSLHLLGKLILFLSKRFHYVLANLISLFSYGRFVHTSLNLANKDFGEATSKNYALSLNGHEKSTVLFNAFTLRNMNETVLMWRVHVSLQVIFSTFR